MATIDESVREREALRFIALSTATSVIVENPSEWDSSKISPSSDAALTAFAQLAALRLDADRCMISLFDQQYQHIIAESTRFNSIEPDSKDSETDDDTALWLSGLAIPRSHGVCEGALGGQSPSSKPSTSAPPDRDGGSSKRGRDRNPASGLVILDMLQDARYSARPYLGATRPARPYRFYAGVPICSPRGIDIGVLCVFDGKPRSNGLDAKLLRVMQALSRTVMAHLQDRTAQITYRRNSRMVRGLGSLVEGRASMSRWWMGADSASFPGTTDIEGSLNQKQQNIQRELGDEGQVLLARNAPRSSKPSPTRSPDIPAQEPSNSVEVGSLPSSEDFGPPSSSRLDAETTTGPPSGLLAPHSDNGRQKDGLEMLFARAANIVRESVEVEGVLFLDAAISSFGGSIGGVSSDNSDGSEFSDRSAHSNPPKADEEAAVSPSTRKVLGFSTTALSSIDGGLAGTNNFAITERALKSLLRRYPHGHIFNLDENGGLLSTDSESDGATDQRPPLHAATIRSDQGGPGATARKATLRPRDVKLLAGLFTDAQSIAFVPFWDSIRERWFAGGFVWTCTPHRQFSLQGELSYLRAFATTVMAEVSHLDLMRANKVKSDVLGSVSHELRSPLHGIILGVELLHDTALNGFQEDVLHTMETCSRTLSDTLDHVLDYSKINHYVHESKRQGLKKREPRGVRSGPQRTIESGLMSLYADVNLDSLLEEVIESVYAGFSFQKTSSGWARRTNGPSTDHARSNTMRRIDALSLAGRPNVGDLAAGLPSSHVATYLDIEPSVDWVYYAQPGALRRIFMNLFGNALKYTDHGSIMIQLSQRKILESNAKSHAQPREVLFTISDSGSGISADYLRNRLYTPFAQENQLAPGAGLGLSMVKQIISALGGRISIHSQPGHGTTVQVFLPLTRSQPRATRQPQLSLAHTPMEADFAAQLDTLKDHEVCLLGLATSTGTKAAVMPLSPLLRFDPSAFMETMCKSWLGLQPVPAAASSPSLYVTTEDDLHQVTTLPAGNGLPAPVVVICNSALSAHELAISYKTSTDTRIFEFISQPAGPRKLAKILTLALKQYQWARELASPDISVLNLLNAKAVQHEQPNSSLTQTYFQLPISNAHGGIHTPGSATSGFANIEEVFPSPLTPLQQDDTTGLLLVDDNAINIKILASFMIKSGRTYGTASNGLQALEAYKEAPSKYRCILMDISMPVMDGIESTRQIRKLERRSGLAPTLIIALTGLASSATQQEAFTVGVDLFLTKPVRLKELEQVLQSRSM